MSDARSEDERLPWLDSPRRAKPAAPPRRKLPRAPIYALLSLFLLASVGVMAFLVGRGSVPVEPVETPATIVPQDPPAAIAPAPAPTIAEPAPAPVAEQVKPAPARRATRARRPAARRGVLRAPPGNAALEATRIAQEERPSPAPVARPIIVPPAPPVIRATSIVQIGTYRSRARAEAAHRRLIRVYPYVRTLPKIVRPIRPAGSRRIFYRLQYQSHSPDYARILCRNLRAIGRGCAVLPAGR